MLRASTVIFAVTGLSNDNLLCHQWSHICVWSTVLTISWNTTHQCIHSTVWLIILNQSVLEFGAKRRHKKKQTNIINVIYGVYISDRDRRKIAVFRRLISVCNRRKNQQPLELLLQKVIPYRQDTQHPTVLAHLLCDTHERTEDRREHYEC